jgi:hypothetical protein
MQQRSRAKAAEKRELFGIGHPSSLLVQTAAAIVLLELRTVFACAPDDAGNDDALLNISLFTPKKNMDII